VTAALEARALTVSFGRTPAVRAVSASVGRGEWVALIGPNGAGKTTTLRALAGLVGFDGSVLLGGRPLASIGRREVAREVALVPQHPHTPPELTVAEYVLLGRTPHIGYLATETHADRAAAARAIDRLALRPFVERRLGSLSGGELQRAVLARALAQEAAILLLDEPTSALDLGRQQQALELVDALRRADALTVVSAMHDLSLAAQYADRLLLLDRGRLVAEGAADEVLSEATIGSYYGAEVRIVRDEGGVYVLPRRRTGRVPAAPGGKESVGG
jgi:iron complex transport system ATP-binding protein